ncbi:MAG: hypothetical protein H0T50_09605 [Gemmatimonadales bacterium]|nr:hypothetical protein [Gemmatimonadales bacterium]
MQTLEVGSSAITYADRVACDLTGFTEGIGHPDFPCLSRAHSPSSCVPCVDFSPWLRDRVNRGDAESAGEYLWRVRQANPGAGASEEEFRGRYRALAESLLEAQLGIHLRDGSDEAYLDLRVALILLAAHEGFSGFIMTGEAADFLAAALCPHGFTLVGPERLVGLRNEFVQRMASEMSYWSTWPPLAPDALLPLVPPDDPHLTAVLDLLLPLPLGARAHAADVLRHLVADPSIPRTLASLSRYETRKRGLDVAESTRLIMDTGLVVPATELKGWLSGWTRRDLLGFLAHCGVRPRNSWSKERLAEAAEVECVELLRQRMSESGVVELNPKHIQGARLLQQYLDGVKETWRVWLGFGTGVAS